MNRAERTYDAQGHVLEEKQILDNPETMIPAETRAQMLEQSGLSADQLQQEIETTYNEHGDAASEITRSTRLVEQTDPSTPAAGLPPYSEVRYSYKYDQRDNWIEKSSSYRSSPDAAFQSSTVIKRTLTYY